MNSAMSTRGRARHPLDAPTVDALWIGAAAALGFRVQRSSDAYASTDGAGTILIGTPDTLDDDDCLAQLVFHELCHALVQGEENLARADWGLDNTSDRDLAREHACLRLQAHLADGHALRKTLCPTTVTRTYYAELPAYPLQPRDTADREACALAAAGARRAVRWQPILDEALRATAAAARASGTWVVSGHPLGFAVGPVGERCGGCTWCYATPTGARCRQSGGGDPNGQRVDADFPACARWEGALDCRDCAACCREGFDSVSLAMRDPLVWRHPELVVRNGPRFTVLRAGNRCAALEEAPPRFSCAVYADRPQACREVMPGDRRCLDARRRVGRSAG
jgi:hypothetical protein